MSDLPTAHEHLERAEAGVHHGEAGGSATIPLSIAIMAVCAAVLGSLESASSAAAVVARSTAAIRQGEATDAWSFYQATSVKKNLYELFGEMPAMGTDAVRQKAERYAKDQQDIERQAREKEAQVAAQEALSETAMEQHHRLIVATNFVHLAIALASVSMLVRRNWLWFISLGCATLGVGVGAWSYMA
jgi:hypothetical protein